MHASPHRLHNKVLTAVAEACKILLLLLTLHEMCAETSMLLLMTGWVVDASGSKPLASKQRFLKIT